MESFPAFSGRTESHDLICIRHTYQNDKICKPIGLLKSYDNRTKALENIPPPEFLGEKLTGPCLNLLEKGWFSLGHKHKHKDRQVNRQVRVLAST